MSTVCCKGEEQRNFMLLSQIKDQFGCNIRSRENKKGVIKEFGLFKQRQESRTHLKVVSKCTNSILFYLQPSKTMASSNTRIVTS